MNVPATQIALFSALFAATALAEPFPLSFPPPALVGTPQPIKIDPEKIDKSSSPTTIDVPAGTQNLALGKAVSASDDLIVVGELDYITDGDKDGDEGYEVELAPGLQWVQIDLQQSAKISAVALWHYHRQKRVYHDVVIQASNDPDFKTAVYTLFNNDFDNSAGFGHGNDKVYIETHLGKIITLPNDIPAMRYWRFYSNGNSSDSGNHYIEIELYGIPKP
ncbi:MAG: discoidin domain-containing protein [Opitutales bacterium]|nr:discoidin domain-containing protein [Opitutales bacterium]